MSKETINEVLAEFGQQIGLDGLQLDHNGYAAVAFDDVVVNLEYDGDRERLILCAYLGQPEGDRLKAYELLLDANFCWQGTGGGTLSLERDTGGVVLFDALATRMLEAEELETKLEAFVNTAEAWTAQLGRIAPAAAEEDGGLPSRTQPIIRG